MAKKQYLFLLLFCTWCNLFAQNTEYFQQEVNYKINVTLDDKQHILNGAIDMEYINHSPSELNEIWIHLWGNAYKNQKTAFAKQQLVNGKKRFFFAEDEDMGYFANIDFKIDGTTATWSLDKKNPDIALLKLSSPLKSGEKINISTPFSLKIPASFSRLGHVGESYQMTQWFPKPAVFDNRGWHPIPYLDQGEFYSEFGNFDVSITLPENYVVGATGVLQTESEKIFLQKQVAKSKQILDTIKTKGSANFPASSSKTKTIRYIAQNVHDFAWFADKRFYVTHEIASLENGQKVDCYAMFTDFERELWKKGAFYVKRSVEYYSKHVGNYPYPHATAVQSALSAGGGMEYPMITVIDKAGDDKTLDIVITHEVGHNWFYGILASNERNHGWMDEGMNSYYEERYTAEYYPKVKKENEEKKKGFSLNITLDDKVEELGFQWFARQALDQPCAMHSADFTSINYGLVMYKKTARSMRALENFVGTTTFDKIMKSYYELWKFKHPYPSDFRKHWESNYKEKDITWFFDGLIEGSRNISPFVWESKRKANQENQISLVVGAKGNLKMPIPVNGVKDGKVVKTLFYELPKGKSKMEVTFPKGDYDLITADYDRNLPATHRFPNLDGMGKKTTHYWLPKFKAISILESEKKANTYGILPAISYNFYDKTQLGAVLYTPFFPTIADGHAYIMPLYSFEQKQWNGSLGSAASKYFEKGKIRAIELNANLRRYSQDYDYYYKQNDLYFRSEIGLAVDFRKTKLTSPISHRIEARTVGINQQYIIGINRNTLRFRDTSMFYAVHELKYIFKNDFILKPTKWTVTLQNGKGFTKLFTHFNQRYQLNRKNEIVFFHVFAGTFLQNNNPIANVNFRGSGYISKTNSIDYMYDNLLFARGSSKTEGDFGKDLNRKEQRDSGITFLSQQIFMQDANLKTVGIINNFQGNKWMIGFGTAYQIPFDLPIKFKPYFDIAFYPNLDGKIDKAWSAGITTAIIPDVFEINFPIPIKKNNSWNTLDKNLEFGTRTRYMQRVSFMFNINELNPYKKIKNFKLNI